MKIEDPNRYQLKEFKGEAIPFTDFNFKLAVIGILMYEKELLLPKFDLYGFVERHQEREIDIEEEGYEYITEVNAYFKDLCIDKSFAKEITEIYQDEGNEIYAQLVRFWDGENDAFNITSTEDVKHFPNLKKVTLFYEYEPIVKNQFEKLGISAEYL